MIQEFNSVIVRSTSSNAIIDVIIRNVRVVVGTYESAVYGTEVVARGISHLS
ncbi:hypothetical protein PGB90_006128 [Kerria lacca]